MLENEVRLLNNTVEKVIPLKEAQKNIFEPKECGLLFSMNKKATGFDNLIRSINDSDIDILHIESRPKQSDKPGELEILMRLQLPSNQKNDFMNKLKDKFQDIQLMNNTTLDEHKEKDTVWFPKHISDLDQISNNVLMYGKELDADHPGFKDEEYRKRRNIFADIAYNYRYGQPIPKIVYTEQEKKTWNRVYNKLTSLYKKYACQEYQENLVLLQKYAGYNEHDLPQQETVSKFLKERTGFTLRPVAGYLSARDFFSGLAFRVFYCTQYIRHHADPFYSPEPDCCHELLGHMPLFANPKFAQFSQEIGLASLGASDEEIKKLASCYFFSIEFGVCRQNGELKAYGAGLLSSAAELEHALSGKAVIKPFIPSEVRNEECLVTTYQRNYFETSSFDEVTEKMRSYIATIDRPFELSYDPFTQSVEVINNIPSLMELTKSLKRQLFIMESSLEKMNKQK